MGRLDWWNIKGEHTPFEWACQLAMYEAAPFGERRADIRAATNTVNAIVASAMVKISSEDANALFRQVANYLECDQDEEEAVDLDALQRMKEKECQA